MSRQVIDALRAAEKRYSDLDLAIEQGFAEQRRKIKDNLKAMQQAMAADVQTAQVVSQIKELAENIESALYTLKEAERATLLASEATLTHDINLLQEYLQNRDPVADKVPPERKVVGKREQVDGLLAEVAEYNAFVSAHGRYDGWDESAHLAFQRIYSKMQDQNHEAIARVCVERLPGVDLHAALQHLQWWSRLEYLTQAKKTALSRWKNQRAQMRAAPADDAAQNSRDQAEADENEKSKTARHKSIVQNAMTKEAIKEWKENARRQKEQEEQEAQLRKQAEETKKLRQRELDKMHKQSALAEYHDRKRREAELEAQRLNSQGPGSVLSEIDIQRLEARNAQHMQRKEELGKRKEEQATQRDRVVQKLLKKIPQPTVPNDPMRVLRPTVVHQRRLSQGATQQDQAERQVQRAFVPSSSVRLVQHRAIPAWRQGVP
ncbi:hypothetical protein RI367_002546 [Sorochytrium milnesiophthora]